MGTSDRVIDRYIHTWDGGGIGQVAGYCVCDVIENADGEIRIRRGPAIYIKDHPEIAGMLSVFRIARKELMDRKGEV